MDFYVWDFQTIPTSPAYYSIDTAKKFVEPLPFTVETKCPFFCIGFRPKDGTMKLNVFADKKPVKPVPMKIEKGEPSMQFLVYGFSSSSKTVGMTYHQKQPETGKVVQFGVHICNVKYEVPTENRFLAWNIMDGLQGAVLEPTNGKYTTGMYNKPEFVHFIPKLTPGTKLNWVKCMGKPVPAMKEKVVVSDYTTILTGAFSIRVDKPETYTIEANYGDNKVERFQLDVVPELTDAVIGDVLIDGEVIGIGSEYAISVEKKSIQLQIRQKVPLFNLSLNLDSGTIQDLDGGEYVLHLNTEQNSKLSCLITAHNRKNKANLDLVFFKIKSE